LVSKPGSTFSCQKPGKLARATGGSKKITSKFNQQASQRVGMLATRSDCLGVHDVPGIDFDEPIDQAVWTEREAMDAILLIIPK
jgi:hypothetical protein